MFGSSDESVDESGAYHNRCVKMSSLGSHACLCHHVKRTRVKNIALRLDVRDCDTGWMVIRAVRRKQEMHGTANAGDHSRASVDVGLADVHICTLFILLPSRYQQGPRP